MPVLNNVLDAGILSNAPHADSVGVVAPQILHKHMRGVWLRGEAVIANVNAAVGDAEPIDIERVESIGVFG